MANLTKQEERQRKNCLLKAHYWYGSKFAEKELSQKYDIYIDYENAMIYIYKKEVQQNGTD